MRMRYTHFISAKADICLGILGGGLGYFMHEKERPKNQQRRLADLFRRRMAHYGSDTATGIYAQKHIDLQDGTRGTCEPVKHTEVLYRTGEFNGSEYRGRGRVLLALLVCTLAVKFTLSVVKVLLDCLMCVLALVCVLAILRPGPKNGPVSIVLGYIEAFVDPTYHWMAERVSRIASGPILKLFLFLKRNNNPRVAELLGKCAKYTDCLSCVNDHDCGYFYDTGVCVPGSWLKPHANHTDSGAAWSYYHGHCRISTRVEFVVLPALLALATLAAAVIALWRRWSHGSTDDQSSCASSEADIAHSSVGGRHHHHYHHHGDERTPLLIDNDPASRPSALAMSSSGRQANELGIDIAGNPRQASLEEQYGSWCQRSANKG
ncbi:hypothetical protein FB645_003426 [Coemansia sp. IMI 203386]|nr:hypothetical protein FB645_003426 [Coemansia sp. IMI 203386]